MNESEHLHVRQAIESILMVATDPVPPNLLAQLLEKPTSDIETICESLSKEYEQESRGFILVKVGGGYRYQSHPEQAPWVERFVIEGQSLSLIHI